MDEFYGNAKKKYSHIGTLSLHSYELPVSVCFANQTRVRLILQTKHKEPASTRVHFILRPRHEIGATTKTLLGCVLWCHSESEAGVGRNFARLWIL